VLYDPFFLAGVTEDTSLRQPDGLHPNARGVAIEVARFTPLIRDLLGRVPPK
jgi:acyl-CoA thioesterase-1